MLVKAEQNKREYCIAVMNRLMHKNNICPGNHDVDYRNGWFYCDDQSPEQRPELTEQAEQEMNNPEFIVAYSSVWNTYVIMDNPDYEYDDLDY